MKKYMICLIPILAIDIVTYVAGLILVPAVSDSTDWRALLLEIVQYLLAGSTGLLAGWIFGSRGMAILLGLFYWLVWRSVLFTLGTFFYVSRGYMPDDYFWPALAAFAVSLFLFSPIALLVSWIGGVIGRRYLYSGGP